MLNSRNNKEMLIISTIFIFKQFDKWKNALIIKQN